MPEKRAGGRLVLLARSAAAFYVVFGLYTAAAVFLLLFGVIPAALFLAIARDRLFDIDLVIGRTLVYGALTAVLAVTFFGSVFLLQQVLRNLIGGPNEFAVAGAALINGLLFQPVRRRIQHLLENRLRRPNRDWARTLAEFRSSLRREELDREALRKLVLATVRDVLNPVRTGLWVRVREKN